MPIFGLIGHPVAHSNSPKLFHQFFERAGVAAEYRLWDLESIAEVQAIFATQGLMGFNITSPYKDAIIPHLDRLDNTASTCRAVNTVVRKGGQWVGYNTDVAGFRDAISPALDDVSGSALILGSGGAARAAEMALQQMGIESVMVSRRPETGMISYEDLDEETMHRHAIIIQATPVGLGKPMEAPDIPYKFIDARHLCFDMVYFPPETAFMLRCTACGAKVIGGMPMLEAQARAGFTLWLDALIDKK